MTFIDFHRFSLIFYATVKKINENHLISMPNVDFAYIFVGKTRIWSDLKRPGRRTPDLSNTKGGHRTTFRQGDSLVKHVFQARQARGPFWRVPGEGQRSQMFISQQCFRDLEKPNVNSTLCFRNLEKPNVDFTWVFSGPRNARR